MKSIQLNFFCRFDVPERINSDIAKTIQYRVITFVKQWIDHLLPDEKRVISEFIENKIKPHNPAYHIALVKALETPRVNQ